MAKFTSPANIAGMVCAAPRNGTWTALRPVRAANRTPGEMWRSAWPRTADRDAIRSRLRPGDEIAERFGRHMLGGDHGHVRQFVSQRRRDQILFRVVRHFRDEELVDRKVPDCRPADHITVRGTLRDGINSYITGGARPVFHNEGLTELVLKPLGEDAKEHVGRAASRIRHDEAHRTIRPDRSTLSPCGRCANGSQGSGGSQHRAT